MKSKPSVTGPRALVTVFDDLSSAQSVLGALGEAGFAPTKLQLVTGDLKTECPEVETPRVHETTSSVLASDAAKGAGIGLGLGAGFGVAATIMSTSPAVAVGAMIYAGLAGALVGGIGGIDRADIDDSVNLPSLDEYQRLVDSGNSLVVVQGTHDEVLHAESIMKQNPHLGSHVHRLHGHLFHEHPAHPESAPPRD